MKEMNDEMKTHDDYKKMRGEDGEMKHGAEEAKMACAEEMVNMSEDLTEEDKEKFRRAKEMMMPSEDDTESDVSEEDKKEICSAMEKPERKQKMMDVVKDMSEMSDMA